MLKTLKPIPFCLAVFAALPVLATELTLDAQARSEVENDEMSVLLSVDTDGQHVQTLSQSALATLQRASAKAKRNPAVSVRVGNINTYPVWGPKGKTANWHVHAELSLKSTDFAALGLLASELTSDMQISNVAFALSPVRREAEEAKLITEASRAFKQKATALSTAFGFRTYTVKSVNFSQQYGGMPHPMATGRVSSMAMEASVPIPSEGGKSEVSVNMQGVVEPR